MIYRSYPAVNGEHRVPWLRIFLFSAATCLMLSGPARAKEPAGKNAVSRVQPPAVTLTGAVIDNLCLQQHRNDVYDFVKMHGKDCPAMTNPSTTGYSLVTDDKVIPFTKESGARIRRFLGDSWSVHLVEVTGAYVGGEFKLKTIHNQKNLKLGSMPVRLK